MFRQQWVVWWDPERCEVHSGQLIHKTKDQWGHPHTYLVASCYGEIAVHADHLLYIGGENDIPAGLLRIDNFYQTKLSALAEKIEKLEKSHELMIATLKAVRDILQEGKEDGKSKTCRGVCSGGCSGDHKSCHSHRVQKPR